MRSLIRAFASHLNTLGVLLTEHHLEFLSLNGGYTGLSESTLVKMPTYWPSNVTGGRNTRYHVAVNAASATKQYKFVIYIFLLHVCIRKCDIISYPAHLTVGAVKLG